MSGKETTPFTKSLPGETNYEDGDTEEYKVFSGTGSKTVALSGGGAVGAGVGALAIAGAIGAGAAEAAAIGGAGGAIGGPVGIAIGAAGGLIVGAGIASVAIMKKRDKLNVMNNSNNHLIVVMIPRVWREEVESKYGAAATAKAPTLGVSASANAEARKKVVDNGVALSLTSTIPPGECHTFALNEGAKEATIVIATKEERIWLTILRSIISNADKTIRVEESG